MAKARKNFAERIAIANEAREAGRIMRKKSPSIAPRPPEEDTVVITLVPSDVQRWQKCCPNAGV